MIPRSEPALSVLGEVCGEGGGQEAPWPSMPAHLLCPRAGPARLPSSRLPRAWGKRPRPEAPPGGPAQRLCLLRTWRGLGFPSAKLGSPPTLTTERGPQSEATAKPGPPALLPGEPRAGGAGVVDRCAGSRAQVRARVQAAGGGCLGPLPVPTPPSRRAGVRSAIPTRARPAECPGQIDRLARAPASGLLSPGAPAAPKGLRGWAPPLFAALHLHSN